MQMDHTYAKCPYAIACRLLLTVERSHMADRKPVPAVTLVRSACQSSRDEIGKGVEFPGGIPGDLARAVVKTVDVDWKRKPECIEEAINA